MLYYVKVKKMLDLGDFLECCVASTRFYEEVQAGASLTWD